MVTGRYNPMGTLYIRWFMHPASLIHALAASFFWFGGGGGDDEGDVLGRGVLLPHNQPLVQHLSTTHGATPWYNTWCHTVSRAGGVTDEWRCVSF